MISSQNLSGQGGLDHIKNQKYMKYYDLLNINCDSIPDSLASMLTYRICANIKLQKSDSILTLYYDSLKTEMFKFGGNIMVQEFDSLQFAWRNYRDSHCKVIWDKYKDAFSGHMRAIHYMDEMKKLTDIRISEIKRLIYFYREEQYK